MNTLLLLLALVSPAPSCESIATTISCDTDMDCVEKMEVASFYAGVDCSTFDEGF